MMCHVVKNCKKIIAISNHSKDVITNIFEQSKEKVITISNGYDEKTFYQEDYKKEEILKELEIYKNYDKIVCFAGRLAKNKGVDLLLQAAKEYENGNILTLIAGDGEELKNLTRMTQKLRLKDVIFLGNQSHDALRKIYNISDVCVVPSKKEAFGLVALEAIACGTPVVAINQGGIPDFVNDSIGILIKDEDSLELKSAICKVLDNEIKFDSKSLAKYAKDNYRQDLFIDRLINVYEESLN